MMFWNRSLGLAEGVCVDNIAEGSPSRDPVAAQRGETHRPPARKGRQTFFLACFCQSATRIKPYRRYRVRDICGGVVVHIDYKYHIINITCNLDTLPRPLPPGSWRDPSATAAAAKPSGGEFSVGEGEFS
eukprot:1939532-Pyramimonas_sp.AAC.1